MIDARSFLSTLGILILCSGSAHALTVASVEESSSRDQARDAVNQRLETESAARADARARAADKDSIVLALKALKRKEAAKALDAEKPPPILPERLFAFCAMVAVPALLSYLLFVVTRSTLRQRDRERSAMVRTFTPKPADEPVPKPTTKVPLSQFLADNKEKYQKLSGEHPIAASTYEAADHAELSSVHLEKYDFEKLYDELRHHFAAVLTVAAGVPAAEYSFNKLIQELPALSGNRSGNGRFGNELKLPAPKPKFVFDRRQSERRAVKPPVVIIIEPEPIFAVPKPVRSVIGKPPAPPKKRAELSRMDSRFAGSDWEREFDC